MVRFIPDWVENGFTGTVDYIGDHKKSASLVCAAVVIAAGAALFKYGEIRAENAAEVLRIEERQAAAEREEKLKAQFAALQRASRRRTGLNALSGVGRYPSDYSTADMLRAGYSGRITNVDADGTVNQNAGGVDAIVGGVVDSTLRTPTRLLRRCTKDVWGLKYLTAFIDGTVGAVTGIPAEILTGTDSLIRGANSVKPADYGNKPAVNDVDPASRELGTVKVFGASVRAWGVWSLFGRSGSDGGSSNNNYEPNDPNSELEGTMNGGDDLAN